MSQRPARLSSTIGSSRYRRACVIVGDLSLGGPGARIKGE